MPTRREYIGANPTPSSIAAMAGVASEVPRRFLARHSFPPGGPEHEGLLFEDEHTAEFSHGVMPQQVCIKGQGATAGLYRGCGACGTGVELTLWRGGGV